MANLTLTQTCLKLLEKEENREPVNNYVHNKKKNGTKINFYRVIWHLDHFYPYNLCFHFYDGRFELFENLYEEEQLYIIRVCLEVLPFFERENPEYKSYEQYVFDPDYAFAKYNEGQLLHTAKTIKAKYQQLLYLPIPDLDAKFLEEGIKESDLS